MIKVGILGSIVLCGLTEINRVVHAQSTMPKNAQLIIDAEKGDVKAMVDLARQYQFSDADMMVSWLRKAVQKDYPPAPYKLGQVLMSGYFSKSTGNSVHIKSDPTSAARLYTRAAMLGYSPAQIALAQCYEKGQGVQQSDREAYRWCAIAVKDKENTTSQIWGNSGLERLSLKMKTSDVQSAQSSADSYKPLTSNFPQSDKQK